MKYIKSKIIKETLKKLDLEEEREFFRDLTSNGIQYIENNFELRLLEMEKEVKILIFLENRNTQYIRCL